MKPVLVAYYFAVDDVGMDVFCCDAESDGIVKLTEVMKEFNTCRADEKEQDKLLDTARAHAERSEIDQALQCLDTWCEEFNDCGRSFCYTIKDAEG